MKIFLFDPNSTNGIRQASYYLRDYLSQYHTVDMFSYDHSEVESFILKNFNHDLLLIHDFSIDISNIKNKTDKPIAYFVPGIYPHQEGERNILLYDYVLSPSRAFHPQLDINHIQWCFDIPHQDITNFSNRKDDLLYIGRIDNRKLSSKFLIEMIKHNQTMTLIGNIRVDNEEEFLMKKMIEEYDGFHYQSNIEHSQVLEIMTKHKYSVLASQTDIFSLFMLESIYAGCIPFVQKRAIVEYAWSVSSTHMIWNVMDIVNLYIQSKSLPDEINQQYRDFHYNEVCEKMKRLSDINLFNQVFDN